MKRPKPGKPPVHPPVTVFETGQTFETYTEAGESVGCTRWSVMRCCRGVQSDSHGYHFYYDPKAEGFDWVGKYYDEDLWFDKYGNQG